MPTFRAIATATQNNSSTLVGDSPTGTADGDALVAIIVTRPEVVDTYGTMTPPSGWVLRASETAAAGGALRVYVYTKIAASEGASWMWTWSVGGGSSRAYLFVCAYSAGNASHTVDSVLTQVNATVDSTCETPAITPTSQPGSLISFTVNGDGITNGYFAAGVTLSAGTQRAFLGDDPVGGYLRMNYGDDTYAALSTIASRTGTAGYGTSPSIGVSILLRDSGYTPTVPQFFQYAWPHQLHARR